MTRSALLQYYALNEGTVFEEFDDITDWTSTDNSATIAEDTVDGIDVIKITPVAASAGQPRFQKTISGLDYDNCNRSMALDVYLYDDVADYTSINVYFSSHETFGKYAYYAASSLSAIGLEKGWNRIIIPATSLVLNNGELYTNTFTGFRIRFIAASGKQPSIGFKQLKLGYKGKPVCMFAFDRGYASGYTEGLSYLISKGLKGIEYILPRLVDTDGFVTTAQLTTAYAAGCAIGQYPLDWTYTDKDSCVENLTEIKDWLIANSFSRAWAHVGYPSGNYSDATGLAMEEVGVKTGREGDGRINLFRPYNLKRHALSTTPSVTLATAKGYLDTAIEYGEPCMFLIHTLSATPADSDWSISDFQALVDYAIARKVDIVTIDEYYEGLTNPRYRSLSLARTTV